jgi:transposase
MSKTNENKEVSVPLKAYSLKELAQIYDVSTLTLRHWISAFKEELGVRRGRYYTIPQVKIIFENLSLPSVYYEK